jgi:hypothetical protein
MKQRKGVEKSGKRGRKREPRRGVSQFTFFRPFLLPFSMDFFQFFWLGSSCFPFLTLFLHIRIEKGEKNPVKTGGNHKKPEKGEKEGRKKGTVKDPIIVLELITLSGTELIRTALTPPHIARASSKLDCTIHNTLQLQRKLSVVELEFHPMPPFR